MHWCELVPLYSSHIVSGLKLGTKIKPKPEIHYPDMKWSWNGATVQFYETINGGELGLK